MKKVLFFFCFSISSIFSFCQTVLLDEDFSSGIPSDWTTIDVDQLTPSGDVSYVTDAWISFTTSFDTCAVSTSFYSVNSSQVSKSEDYLISPKLNLQSFGHLLTWESKSFDANYPESYLVLLSTTDSLPSSFTDTLKIVSNVAPNWISHSVNLFTSGFADQSVYIAFRNTSEDAFLLGIDNVKLTTNDPANLKKSSVLNSITAYPNPVRNILNFNEAISASFEVVNMTGQIQLSGSVTENKINLEQLEQGVYFLVLKFSDSNLVKKIVKQ
ncbi:MAG: choice-of-anchor J domain-containing protein [Crocinitomicaceae bacterium]